MTASRLLAIPQDKRHWFAGCTAYMLICYCSCMKLEARPGIEPGCEDLQSSTSPLRHRASLQLRAERAL